MPLRGFTQGSVASPGYEVSWPSGTVAGDIALIHCGGSYANLGPQSSGWTPTGHKSWWKRVTAADLLAPVTVNASHVKLQTFYSASGVGRTSTQKTLKLSPGAEMWIDGQRATAGVAPSTYRLGLEWVDESGWRQAAFHMQNPSSTVSNYVTLPGAPSDAGFYSYEILPPVNPPAPSLLSPGPAAFVDVTKPHLMTWLHEGSGQQTQANVRLDYDSTFAMVKADGTLYAGEWTLNTGAGSATINAGQLTAGTVYTWSVRSGEGGSYPGTYSPGRTMTAVNPPTVSSVTVASTHGDLSPVVTFAAAAGYGVIEAYRVFIIPEGSTAPLWDSGIRVGTPAAVEAANTTPWVNGQTLRAHVEVWQTGNVNKVQADDATFTVSWTPPATPTVTAVDGAPPVVTVAGLTSGHLVTVEMLAGGVWRPFTLRTAAGATLEVEAPLAAGAVKFRARQGNVIDGVPMQSAWAESAQITVSANDRAYLVDDADRSTYLVIEQHQDTDQRRTIVQGMSTLYGLGATSARVEQTPAAGQAGAFSVLVGTESDASDVWAWLDARDVFWFKQRPDYWGTKAVEAVRVARTSRLGSERVVGSSGWRRLDVEWVEQPE